MGVGEMLPVEVILAQEVEAASATAATSAGMIHLELRARDVMQPSQQKDGARTQPATDPADPAKDRP
jgi:hypothetical protein